MKKFRIEIKWAIIFSLAELAWTFAEKWLGWHNEHIDKHSLYTNFFGLVAVILYIFELYDKRENFYYGRIGWREGFISGVAFTLFIALLSPLVQYLSFHFISPNFFENSIAYVTKSGRMKAEVAQEYFNMGAFMLQAAFGALGMGVATAALVALLLRRKKEENKAPLK